jgi:hypothetical protein
MPYVKDKQKKPEDIISKKTNPVYVKKWATETKVVGRGQGA